MGKRISALICLLALCLCGCGQDPSATTPSVSKKSTPSSTAPQPVPTGEVRYVNPDPALQDAWEAIAEEYTEKTGVPVAIVPAAEAGDLTPTLFTVEDEAQLTDFAEICLDLAGVNATHHLQNWSLTLYDGDKMCGLPLQTEGYGLIYNEELLRKVGVTAADITSFAKLTEVVNNIAGNKSLKFKPFACVDMNSAAISLLGTIPGDIRPFWDLYTQNTACANITADDDGPMQEIAEGDAVFCIGSTREFEMLSIMSEGNLNIMPLYIGGENESRQGLCLRVENYLCVRSDVDPLDIQATLDFLDYLIHPADGIVPIDALEVFTPYSTARFYASPLEKTLRDHISAGRSLLVFSQIAAPDGLADALKAYAAAPTDENWALVADILG